MPVVEFLDAASDGVHVFARLVRVAVAAHEPDQVVEIAIPLADVPAPGEAILRAIGERFLDPPFVGTGVTQVNRREKYLYAFLSRLADDPVGVLEIFFIGGGEIPGSGEGAFAVAIHRPAELVLDEIDHQGIEALPAAALEVELGFLPGKA